MKFLFDLGSSVSLISSGEDGIITGRSEYSSAENSYLVRYKAGDGRAVEVWWAESALQLV